MILNQKRKRLFLLPWTMAVLLICIGSLINFHQYKIWHQPLLPQIIAHKKDVEYTITDIVQAKIRADKDKYLDHFPGLPALPSVSLDPGRMLSGFIALPDGSRPPATRAVGSNGLRAPPQA
jgi:hypothetical protein